MSPAVAVEAVDRGYRIVERGVVFTRALTPDEWRGIGRQVARVYSRSVWGLGDWLNAGQVGRQDHQADVAYAMAITGRTYESISQLARVSRAYPVEDRDAPLPWSFYREALRLPEDQRLHALRVATANCWTRDDLADFVHGWTNGASVQAELQAPAPVERRRDVTRRTRNHHLITCPECGHRFTR
jgi:hypothetical protein